MALKDLLKKMTVLEKTNRMERSVAVGMLTPTADRIFNHGLAANNSPIGKYSLGYLKRRVKEDYSATRDVILQFSRQMVNDFSAITGGKQIGLGFKNQVNADKSFWVEGTYKKKIFKSTAKEVKQAGALAQKFVNRLLR